MDELWSMFGEWDSFGWYFSQYLPGWGYDMWRIESQLWGMV